MAILNLQTSLRIDFCALIFSAQEIYSIKLPGDPKLGEGKPENQNHAIIFTRGEAIQTIDMNQVNAFLFSSFFTCILYSCFISNMLSELGFSIVFQNLAREFFFLLIWMFCTIYEFLIFLLQDNYLEEAMKVRNLLEEFKANHGLRPPTILGVREHVFTGRFAILT